MAKQAVSVEEQIAAINRDLKARKTGCTVQLIGDRLYLRGTFPPKPGDGKSKAYFQRIALGIYANPAGIKRARLEAEKLGSDLALGRFNWADWIEAATPKPKQKTVGDWLKEYEAEYFLLNPRNPTTEHTWYQNYELMFRRLGLENVLTHELMLEVISQTQPGSRIRQRLCDAYNRLARFAGMDANFRKLRGENEPKRREIPPDDLILECRKLFDASPSWQWIYSVIAAYGLRNHEAFKIELDTIKVGPLITIREDTKTGRRKALPCWPEWYELFELSNPIVPVNRGRNNPIIGQRVSKKFREFGVPFTPYDLRHAWAIRVARLGVPDSIAARLQGHSLEMHSGVYLEHLSDRDYLAAFELMRGDQI